MKIRKIALSIAGVLVFLTAFAATPAIAKSNEFDNVARHLKSKYRAKKVRMGFVWLARLAVRVVRPAGVKSFNVTLYEDLKFSRDTLDLEMQAVMRDSFGPEWTSVFRVRSRDGQQAYMYMREDGKNIKIGLVTIDKENAAVIRATFSPEKLVEFINNPKIMGVSLDDGDKRELDKSKALKGNSPESK